MDDKDTVFHMGHEELVIRRKFETLSIANDFLIALWFLAGSIMFFWEQTMTIATWCFVLGSLELMARPAIRLMHRFRLQRVGGNTVGSSHDF